MKLEKRIKALRSREGSALLIALMALAGLSILGLSLMLVTETEMQISNDERLRKQALYAAESGIEHALIFMRGIDTKYYGINPNPGVLTGNVGFNAPTQPPDDLMSYNDPIVKAENLYNPAEPWKAPALARRGNILYFDTSWFKAGSTPPTNGYAMRDVEFENAAGDQSVSFDVGTFKSRYSVYVKNNLDDPAVMAVDPSTGLPNPLNQEPDQYEYDQDQRLVLTSEGMVDVGEKGSPLGAGYKVVRTVQVTIRTGSNDVCDDYAGAGGSGGTGNRTLCDEVPIISPAPNPSQQKRNVDWS